MHENIYFNLQEKSVVHALEGVVLIYIYYIHMNQYVTLPDLA